MSNNYGPKIVTDGLVLCLDAADRNSYAVQPELVTDSNLSTIGDGNFRTCFRDASSEAGLNIGPIISGKTYQIIWNVAARRGTTSASFRKGFSVISGSTNANFGIGLKHHVFTSDQTGTLRFYPDNTGCDFDVDYASLREYQPTINDLSGNLNNGTLGNGAVFNSYNGGALVFDGNNDRIECGTFSVPFLTVSTWVYKTTSTSNQGICRKQNGWAVSNYQGVLQVAPGTAWQSFFNTGYTIPLNTWVNIVYTYSGTGATGSQAVYINGSSIYSTSAGSGAISANANQVRVGYDDNNWFWNGRIAQTQIYNKALTSQQILDNYRATKGRFGL